MIIYKLQLTNGVDTITLEEYKEKEVVMQMLGWYERKQKFFNGKFSIVEENRNN